MGITQETFDTAHKWIDGVNAAMFIGFFATFCFYWYKGRIWGSGLFFPVSRLTPAYFLLMGADYIFKLFFQGIASWYDQYILYYVVLPLYEIIFLLHLAVILHLSSSVKRITIFRDYNAGWIR